MFGPRPAIAGAIFIHSRDPTEHWEARGRAIAGELNARHLSAVVSGPLAAGELAFRLSGDWRRSRPASDIADIVRGASPDRDEYGLARFKLLATPEFFQASRLR